MKLNKPINQQGQPFKTKPMKAKHTQGQWENCNSHIFAETKTKDGMHNICQLNVKRSEYQANAKLIAAAPELLKVLKEVVDGLKVISAFESSMRSKLAYDIKIGEEAIKKATE